MLFFLFEVVGDLVECVLFVHPDEGEKMKDESKRCLKFYRGPEKMPGNVGRISLVSKQI